MSANPAGVLKGFSGMNGPLLQSGHTVPGVADLYTCGASTAPVGGIAGSSGKAAALELLKAQP